MRSKLAWALGLTLYCGCVGGLEELPVSEDRFDGDAATPVDDTGPPGSEPPAPLPPPPPDAGAPDTGPPRIVWKGAVAAGDDSIRAFDNARETIYGMFVDDGVLPANLVQLSRSTSSGGVREMSVEGLLDAMLGLDVGPSDGCVLFMTSHGSPTGFYIEGRGEMSPRDLGQILDEACGDRPTIVLVSACYSGIFIELERPNRIILTAARPDRTSFGCGADDTYTYWDTCLIDRFPSVTTWEELYESVTECVVAREAGFFEPSEPQASFGTSLDDLGIFDRR